MTDTTQTAAPTRWNLPPGGDKESRPSDGRITGIEGVDPDAVPQGYWRPLTHYGWGYSDDR